ncbi:hypothetical protein [Acutalibacter intestini]|uniref:hypothetical protein n=1 Tax=Acutalibacter intestini TaxID=3093659 RepID=UPI002AC9C013|nr:hypothetical protein [Acutalibacter sp. M00204]
MPNTLRSTLDKRTYDIIKGCIHCTTITALCSILEDRKIDCSNTVRDEQNDNSISRTIFSRDLNKPGADGVYARFLLNQQIVPYAKYGASGARPVRIYMAKESCFDLQTISISMSDLSWRAGRYRTAGLGFAASCQKYRQNQREREYSFHVPLLNPGC